MPDSMEMRAQQLIAGCVVISFDSFYSKVAKSAEKGCSTEEGAHRALAVYHIYSFDKDCWNWQLAIHELANFHSNSNGF